MNNGKFRITEKDAGFLWENGNKIMENEFSVSIAIINFCFLANGTNVTFPSDGISFHLEMSRFICLHCVTVLFYLFLIYL